MDTHSVPDVGDYMHLLTAQRVALAAAMARRGEQPKDMKSREELTEKHMMIYESRQIQENMTRMNSTLVPPPYPPSAATIYDLKPINIKDLRLETHHRGSYLLVRSLTPPVRMSAIVSVIEDEKGNALLLSLYQHLPEDICPAASFINEKDVFLIKEPYFKSMADGSYGIRVDHVSDIVYLAPFHDLYPKQWSSLESNKSAVDWKQKGNEAIKSKNYSAAIRSYTAGLHCCTSPEVEQNLHLNCALSHFKEGSFDAVLVDTQGLISLTNPPEKALYRASQALYELERFPECSNLLTNLLRIYPGNPEAVNLMTRTSDRLAERQNGTYDFDSIYKELQNTRPPRLDRATFVGPVTVRASPGRGQGLFTTKAVETGELLLCEKAFTFAHADSSPGSTKGAKVGLLMNLHTNEMTMGTQGDLIANTVQKLWKNPSLLPKFAALHHGAYNAINSTEVDGNPIIDSFLVEQIISFNVFGCPSKSDYHDLVADNREDSKLQHSSGIWLMASKINHSCLQNVNRSFMGDLLFLRATCDIPADTELTFWYAEVTGDGNEIDKSLRKWGFECGCAMCLDSKSTSKRQLAKRTNLFRDLEDALGANNCDTDKAERLLAAFEATYRNPPTHVPRLDLQKKYLNLSQIHAARPSGGIKAVEMALMALESLGFVIKGGHLFDDLSDNGVFEVKKWGFMTPNVISAFCFVYELYDSYAPQLCDQAGKYARLSYKVCYGEDITFKRMYDEMQAAAVQRAREM